MNSNTKQDLKAMTTQEQAELLAKNAAQNVIGKTCYTSDVEEISHACCLPELLAVAKAATKHERCIIEGSTVIPPHVKTYNDTSVKLRASLTALRAKLKERGIEL